MNKQAFYRGILAELEKLAYIPYNQPKPQSQKTPFYKSPKFWAGVGGAGLAGLGAYSYLKGHPNPIQNPAVQPTTISNDLTTPNLSNSLAGKINTASTVGQGGLGLASLASNIPKINKVPGLNKLPLNRMSGPANLLGSIGMISDAVDPNNQSPLSAKEVEGGAGAVDGAATVLNSRIAKPLAEKLAPTMTGWAGEVLGSPVARALGSMPLTGAYAAGAAGQGIMSAGTQSAEAQSNLLGNAGDDMIANRKNITHFPRFSPEYDRGLQNSYDMFNDPDNTEILKRVTDPTHLDRLGYGQYYHMPQSLGGKGYNSGPETSMISNELAKQKDLLNKEMKETGMGEQLAKTEFDTDLARHLALAPENSYANNVPNIQF